MACVELPFVLNNTITGVGVVNIRGSGFELEGKDCPKQPDVGYISRLLGPM